MDQRATPDDVRYAYRLLLGREPDAAGYKHFLDRIEAERLTTRRLVADFLGSAEFAKFHGSAPMGELPLTDAAQLNWQACTLASLQSQNFQHWTARLRERQPRPHRKVWEWAYIAQALYERGYLQKGSRGLGFAVGTEPLSALFASMDCQVLATDLDLVAASAGGWTRTHEHAENIGVLNERGICAPTRFSENVRFANVDMCNIPDSLVDFDFCGRRARSSISAASMRRSSS